MKIANPLYYLIPFLLILFMFFGWQTLSHAIIHQNSVIPSFNLPLLYHPEKQLTKQDLKDKVVLINFWASWCPPCHAEHPLLLTIKKNNLIPIYGINFSDNPNNAKKMLDKLGNPYSIVAIDEDMTMGNALGFNILPQTFLIDAHGMIRYQHQGTLTQNEWENVLMPLVQKVLKE